MICSEISFQNYDNKERSKVIIMGRKGELNE